MSGRGLLGRLDLPITTGKPGTAHVGTRQSKLRGSGVDVVSTRPYVPGDDPRVIDWPATARTGELHSRVTLALRARRVHIVLGGGGRMSFGPSKTKWATAVEVARLLADVAHASQDLLTLHTGHDAVSYHSPGRRLNDQLAFINSLGQRIPMDTASGELSHVVNHLVHQSRYKGAIIAISDSFPSTSDISSLMAASSQHAAAFVEVYDPLEWDLPNAGRVRLRGPGGSEGVVRASLGEAQVREDYRLLVQEHRKQWRSKLSRSGVPTLQVSTADSVLRALAKQLPRRR